MKLTIKKKLIVISILLLALPSLVIGVFGYVTAKGSLEDSGKVILKNGVESAIQYIENLDQQVKKGNMTLAEAQENAKEYLIGPMQADGTRKIENPLNLGENGYLMAYDKNGVEMAHPTLEEKNVWDVQDVDGVYIVREQIEAGLNGGGYTEYQWALPNDPNKIAPKITYNDQEPRWGWIISAGTYMQDFNSGANNLLYVLLIVLGASLVVGVIVVILFSNHLAKPLLAVTNQVARVAAGDLTVEKTNVTNRDEIGTLSINLNKMVDNLKEIISNVSETSEQVASTSEELSASAEETSRATETITDNIQEVASGADKQVVSVTDSKRVVTDISLGIEQIVVNVQSINEFAQETTEKVASGSKVIHSTVSQIKTINDKTVETKSVIERLGNKSNEIGSIISLITDIAAQTNLLALNAAIEAARAGDHGKGFAVVADEVRKLAEQSGNAASQINNLVSDIQKDIHLSVESMKGNELAVNEGISLIGKAGEAFEGINKGVGSVSSQLQEVSASVQQISAGAQTMVASIDNITAIFEQSSDYVQSVAASAEEQNASMEEIASASINLSKMAEKLQTNIRTFKL